MAVASNVREVFSHFQNLNLLALLQDLRAGRTARKAWLSGSLLCPVAHGLPAGQQVRDLTALGQTAALGKGCDYAAYHLGAAPDAVLRFVESWDGNALSSDWLREQLEELWHERRADADAVQALLEGTPSLTETTHDPAAEESVSLAHRGQSVYT